MFNLYIYTVLHRFKQNLYSLRVLEELVVALAATRE